MPTITGTVNDDTIEVDNNNGELNNVAQGSPIDDVRGLAGNDTITITDSTIPAGTGSTPNGVRGNAGNDSIIVSNSTIEGVLHAGGDDDVINVSGSDVGNIRMGRGNDTLNFISTDVSGDIRGGGGTDVLNLPVGTVIVDDNFGSTTVQSGVGYSLSRGTFTLPSGKTVSYRSFESGTGFPCFTRDTRILSQNGSVAIQSLRTGDLIPTIGNGLQRIRWIGSRRFDLAQLRENPKLFPVRITVGALGGGLPSRDLLVSRQHSMMVQSKIANRMFGSSEVLIPAIKLTALPGIYVDESVKSVEYFHLLFDRHEVIFAEDAPTESLFTGPQALASLSAAAKEEIFSIFPELSELNYTADPARFVPQGKQQKQLVARHLKNNKPLLHSDELNRSLPDLVRVQRFCSVHLDPWRDSS